MSIILRLCTLIAKKIYPTLERWIPLPPEEERSNAQNSFLIRRVIAGIRTGNPSDYLSYRQYIVSLKIMTAVVVFLALDASFGLGIVISPIEYAHKPLVIAVAFRNLSVIPCILISLIFYVRIRLSMNLATEVPPITCHPAFYDDENQGNWVFRSSIVLMFMPLIVCFSYGAIDAVSGYFGVRDDAAGVLLVTALAAFAVSGAPMFFVMHAIMIEKAYKYFDDLKIHLAIMTRERDAKTDKYIKNKK